MYTGLPKGVGFHGEPPWWPLLPLAVAGAVIRYLPGRGGHPPTDGFKAGGVAQPAELPGIFLAALAGLGLGAVVGPQAPLIALGGGWRSWPSSWPGATCPPVRQLAGLARLGLGEAWLRAVCWEYPVALFGSPVMTSGASSPARRNRAARSSPFQGDEPGGRCWYRGSR